MSEIIKFTSTMKDTKEVDVLYFKDESALNANLDFMKVIGAIDKVDYTTEMVESDNVPLDEIASKQDILNAIVHIIANN